MTEQTTEFHLSGSLAIPGDWKPIQDQSSIQGWEMPDGRRVYLLLALEVLDAPNEEGYRVNRHVFTDSQDGLDEIDCYVDNYFDSFFTLEDS